MSSYPTHLESAKVAALAALFELLVTTTNPIEKRLIATTILRIPDPKPARATDRCSERSVAATPDSHTTNHSSPPESPTHDTGPSTQDTPSSSPHPTSNIPNPTSPPPLTLPEINAFLHILAARHANRNASARSELATADAAPSG